MKRQSLPILEMRGIRKHFGATVALDGVDLNVYAGQVLALVGENGAGKSTLMKALSGAIRPDAGDIVLNGSSFAPRNPHEARLAGVAMVYQELSLAPHMTVAENIMLGMEPVTSGIVQKSEMQLLAARALAQLGHTDIQPNSRVDELSLASRQLVEIGRAIAIGAKVLVLDEPTSSLSSGDTERLFELIRHLKKQGKAIIYISHFLEEVKKISDRFVVLRDGKSVGEGATNTVAIKKIVSLMVGRDISELYPRSKHKAGSILLEVSNLAGVAKPMSVSLKLHRGEVLGIAGLIGAGRSEFLRSLFGLDPVRNGQIKVGTYIGPASPTERWMQGMGMVSEDRKNEGLALSLSVSENITLSKLKSFGPLGLVVPARMEHSANSWIERMQIKCQGPHQSVGTLSGGNQQKVAIARLLQHDVDLLLLDEPTRGIDVGSKAEIYRLIDELASRGKAILMVSSYLPELLGICDRVAVMYRGKLNPARRADTLEEREVMREATGAS